MLGWCRHGLLYLFSRGWCHCVKARLYGIHPFSILLWFHPSIYPSIIFSSILYLLFRYRILLVLWPISVLKEITVAQPFSLFLPLVPYYSHDYTTEPSHVIKQHHCGWKPFWLKGARALQLWWRGLGERSGCWRLLARSRLVMLCSLFPPSRSLLQRRCSEVKDSQCRKYGMEMKTFLVVQC